MNRTSVFTSVVAMTVSFSIGARPTARVPHAFAEARRVSVTGAAEMLTLKDGTPVPLKFARGITSSDVMAGETVELYAADDVRVGDTLVIPKYSSAHATVMLARPRQKVGISGRLQLRFDSVHLADGEDAPVRLSQSVEIGANKGVIIGIEASLLTSAFPATLILMNKTGKDVEIAPDEEVTAYVNANMELDAVKFAAAAPLPAPPSAGSTSVRGPTETQTQLQKLACGAETVALSAHKVADATAPNASTADVPVPEGQALIYVVRPSFVGPEIQIALSVDGEWRGVNLAKSYFHFAVVPGPHYLCSQIEKARTLISLVAETGQTYYVQQKFPYGAMELEVLDETEGKAALAKCKRTEFSVKHETVK
jgi:hypothetical protein